MIFALDFYLCLLLYSGISSMSATRLNWKGRLNPKMGLFVGGYCRGWYRWHCLLTIHRYAGNSIGMRISKANTINLFRRGLAKSVEADQPAAVKYDGPDSRWFYGQKLRRSARGRITLQIFNFLSCFVINRCWKWEMG